MLPSKAFTSWLGSDGYHTPSCSTEQCRCSIYRDLLENHDRESDLKLCLCFGPGAADVTVPAGEKKPLLLLLLHPLCIWILTPTHFCFLLWNVECVEKTLFQYFSNVFTNSQSVLVHFECNYLFVMNETASGPTKRSRSPNSLIDKIQKKEPQPKND